MGRPSVLTPALVEEIGLAVELGARPESVGVNARTLRRWRRAGRAELARLSAPARLELRLQEAEARLRGLSWEATAHLLDDLASEDVLAGFD